jgi:uncharacterized protein YegP (UPF0339 family)
MKIIIFSRRNWLGKLRWYFTIKGANGEPVAQSESYNRKADAVTTAYSLRAKMFDARIVAEDVE